MGTFEKGLIYTPFECDPYRERIEKAIAVVDSFLTFEDVCQKTLEFEYIWHVDKNDDFMVIEIVQEGAVSGVHVVFADYPIARHGEWVERLERFCDAGGFRFIACHGRVGWLKLWKKYGGGKQTGVILRRVRE